jgi:hypothetical protein
MEKVTVEYNGQRYTLEVPTGTTEDQIQNFLSSQTSNQSDVAPRSDAATLAGMAAPAVTAAAYAQPTGLTQLGKDVVQAARPLTQSLQALPATYAAAPGKAVVDVGAAALGLPPPYASLQAARGVGNMFSAAGQTMQNLSDVLNRLPPGTDAQAAKFINELRPAEVQKLGQAINTQGLERAIKTFELPGYVSAEARAGLAATQSAFPTGMQKLGAVAGPLVRGAARVAGPVGLAYDVYEAYPYLKQADLGARSASGETANLRQQAQQRPLNVPTPAPLSRQEAQNLYQSGDMRLRQIYQNDAELASLIRRRAAEQVLGPIAPGSYQ